MFVTLIRTVLIYFFTVLSFRLLGKRQIGELEPGELVVTIIISEVAAAPIQDPSMPLIPNILAISMLLVLEVILSFAAYKNFNARKFFYGLPSIFYEKGRINQKEMEKQRFNLNDLMETVRNTGAVSLEEVEYIIMETNGNVSVIPKADQRPVTLSNIGITNGEEPLLSYVIVDNGHINFNNLNRLGLTQKWIKKQLKSRGIADAGDIFCMTADKRGQVVVLPYAKGKD